MEPPAPEGVGGRGGDGGLLGLSFLLVSSHPLEAPLWDRTLHLKSEHRSGRAEVGLVGAGSCSASNAGWLYDREQVTFSFGLQLPTCMCHEGSL